MKSKQISNIVGLNCFHGHNGVNKFADYEYDIFKSYFEASSDRYRRLVHIYQSLVVCSIEP